MVSLEFQFYEGFTHLSQWVAARDATFIASRKNENTFLDNFPTPLASALSHISLTSPPCSSYHHHSSPPPPPPPFAFGYSKSPPFDDKRNDKDMDNADTDDADDNKHEVDEDEDGDDEDDEVDDDDDDDEDAPQ